MDGWVEDEWINGCGMNRWMEKKEEHLSLQRRRGGMLGSGTCLEGRARVRLRRCDRSVERRAAVRVGTEMMGLTVDCWLRRSRKAEPTQSRASWFKRSAIERLSFDVMDKSDRAASTRLATATSPSSVSMATTSTSSTGRSVLSRDSPLQTLMSEGHSQIRALYRSPTFSSTPCPIDVTHCANTINFVSTC